MEADRKSIAPSAQHARLLAETALMTLPNSPEVYRAELVAAVGLLSRVMSAQVAGLGGVCLFSGYAVDEETRATVDAHLQAIHDTLQAAPLSFDPAVRQAMLDAALPHVRAGNPAVAQIVAQATKG